MLLINALTQNDKSKYYECLLTGQLGYEHKGKTRMILHWISNPPAHIITTTDYKQPEKFNILEEVPESKVPQWMRGDARGGSGLIDKKGFYKSNTSGKLCGKYFKVIDTVEYKITDEIVKVLSKKDKTYDDILFLLKFCEVKLDLWMQKGEEYPTLFVELSITSNKVFESNSRYEHPEIIPNILPFHKNDGGVTLGLFNLNNHNPFKKRRELTDEEINMLKRLEIYYGLGEMIITLENVEGMKIIFPESL
jgi:hypothetical protein